jgi:hypothetical protein
MLGEIDREVVDWIHFAPDKNQWYAVGFHKRQGVS